MAPTYEGRLRGAGRRIAVIVSRTNDFVTRRLLAGAEEVLARHGVPAANVTVVWVPGAFELGTAALRMARTGVDAVVCLGAVIRGETDHYDWVCQAAATGIEGAGRQAGLPVTFGVVTAASSELALARAGGPQGNLGAKAAEAALEMADLWAALPAPAAR